VPVDFGRLLHAIKRHWRALPIAAAIGALVGLAVAALLIKPSYTARATIMWEPSSNAEPSDRSFLTQVDSIKLPVNLMEVRKRVASKLRLDELKEKINLLFDGQSHLVVVEVTEPTGKGAAKLANTTVDVFLEYQRKVGMARGRERLQAIETDIEVAQKQLAEAREGFEIFRKEVGVSDFAVETKLAIENVDRLNQAAEMSNTEALTEKARQLKLTEEVSHAPAVMQSASSLSNPDAIALSQLRTQLVAARAHLASDHPTIIQLEAQVKGLEERVKNNPTMVQGSVSVAPNTSYLALKANLADSKVSQQAAAERQEALRKAAEEAGARLRQLREAEGKAQQFTSRIQLLETRMNELETQRVRVRDEVRNAAADFRVVTAAGVPENSNPSKRRDIAVRFPLAALVLAFLGILAYELKGLRVHTAREAGFWANAAVIASSTWPREQTTLGVLVDELSDAAPAVRGTTLVVGARVNEVPLAREIAYWLSHLTGWSQRGVVGANQPVVEERPQQRGATNVHVAPELGSANVPAAPTGQALARRGSDSLTIAQAWDGPPDGPSLRRAARLADRVLVVIAAGTLSVAEVAQLRSRLGRNSGIGLLLVGLNPDFVRLPDRVGEVERFWEARPA
jgi:uncharacterized protein involved in exopolysaccharide biosynthesis